MSESSYWQHAALRKKRISLSADSEQKERPQEMLGQGQGHPSSSSDLGQTWLTEAGEHSKGRERKTYTRVSRACNGCRKSKMRCTGVDDPPCHRCRVTGEACIIDRSSRGSTSLEKNADDRIVALEAQMSSMQNSLEKVIQILIADSRSSPMSQSLPVVDSRHHFDSHQRQNPVITEHISPTSVISSQTVPPYDSHLRHVGIHISEPSQSPAFIAPSSTTSGSTPFIGSNVVSSSSHLGPSQSQPLQSGGSNFKTQRDLHMSLPPSRAGSEGPGDVLALEDVNNPLGEMSNMAELVEAAVQRAKEGGDSRRRAVEENGVKPPVKKARFSTPSNSDVEMEKGERSLSVSFGDAVQEGLVSEQEARELVDLFFAGSADVCNCFDPTFHTWDSIRARSALCLTSMILVGARVRDGGGPVSDVQTKCFALAQRMAVETFLQPTTSVEDVQGLLLLAAFTDAQNSWLLAGHAVRTAIDLGLHRSFHQLMKSGMGKGKSPKELESDRPLVVNARVWFALYRLEHQMSLGMGRPAILGEDTTIEQCRQFLNHPLTIPNDARLISAVELMGIRNPIHIKLSASPDQPIDIDTLAELKKANEMFDAWEVYWRNLMEEKYKFDPTRFDRESVENMRQLAELFINSQLLRGVREPSDVLHMPEEKRQLALRAMRNAQRSVEICLRSRNYSIKMRHMTHYTHVCAAFVASFLIRIGRLFPDELDMRKTSNDVEQLANVLSQMPAGRRYARSLYLILRKARNAGVIPTEPAPQQQVQWDADTNQNNTNGLTTTAIISSGTKAISIDAYDPSSQGFSAMPSNEIDYLLDPQRLKRAGIFLGEGDPLPLFLDDFSLGTSSGPADSAPFNGLEDFFLPAELDDLLASFQQNPQ